MCPDCAAWQFDTSPSTRTSGKARSSRSLIVSVSSLTFQTRRCGARSNREDWFMSLAAVRIHDPHDERQTRAQQDAGDNREIEAAMTALIGDIARQTAQPKRQPRAEEQRSPGANQHDA